MPFPVWCACKRVVKLLYFKSLYSVPARAHLHEKLTGKASYAAGTAHICCNAVMRCVLWERANELIFPALGGAE